MRWKLAFATFALVLGSVSAQSLRSSLQWSELPPLPDTPGFGGHFVGTHNGALMVAGGANFPDAPPWQGGQKVWYEGIYVLEEGAAAWLVGGQLRAPRAYGAAVSTSRGVALLGGSDSQGVHGDCWLLSYEVEQRTVRLELLPRLPVDCAFPAAALIGETIYCAAGGDGSGATHGFWRLDLSSPAEELRWQGLPDWPGPARQTGGRVCAARARRRDCVLPV